jgi:hypothetical protein
LCRVFQSKRAVVAIWGTVNAQMMTKVDQRRLDENAPGDFTIKIVAIAKVPKTA